MGDRGVPREREREREGVRMPRGTLFMREGLPTHTQTSDDPHSIGMTGSG